MTLRDELAVAIHEILSRQAMQLLDTGKQMVGGKLIVEQIISVHTEMAFTDYSVLRDDQKAVFEEAADKIMEVINEYLA